MKVTLKIVGVEIPYKTSSKIGPNAKSVHCIDVDVVGMEMIFSDFLNFQIIPSVYYICVSLISLLL